MRVELGLGKNWKHIFFAIERKKKAKDKRQETRTKKQEARAESQEARGKNQEVELFAVRFLCDSAPLRAKRRKKQETRAKIREARDKKRETRTKSREPRSLSAAADRQARTKRIKSRFSHLASKFKTPISPK
jgi:hypothetical protein